MHLTARHSRIAAWAAVPLAVLASGAVVATASYAAFSAETDNAGNAWTTGKVALTDDDNGSALFAATDLAPGSTGENCIDVTAETTVDSAVRMYLTNASDADHLGSAVDLHVERGTLTDPADCGSMTKPTDVFVGSLADLATHDAFGSGVGEWSTGKATTTTTYRITYTVDPAADNTLQESSTGASFVWEAQSK
jgi:hypothetical protein